MKRHYSIILLFFTGYLFAEIPDEFEYSFLNDESMEKIQICQIDYDNDSRYEIFLFENEYVDRFTSNLHIYYYEREGRKYKKEIDYGIIKNTSNGDIHNIIHYDFDGIPFPFRIPSSSRNVIMEDIDGDGMEEILLFSINGYGTDYIIHILKINNGKIVDMGKIYGMQTITDPNHDGKLNFIGRTITDSALLSTTDKTYFNYSIINGHYEKTGLIGKEDFSIIDMQLKERFRLDPWIFSFNDLFLFKFVHAESLSECVDWFYENRDFVGNNIKNRDYLLDMEIKYIKPILQLQRGINDPTTWSIFRDRIVDDEYLESLSKSELRLLRNYLFSVNRYKFKSQDLIEYFTSYNVYNPSENFEKSDLSEIEVMNINKILEYE